MSLAQLLAIMGCDAAVYLEWLHTAQCPLVIAPNIG
jgi:hypothetical protein